MLSVTPENGVQRSCDRYCLMQRWGRYPFVSMHLPHILPGQHGNCLTRENFCTRSLRPMARGAGAHFKKIGGAIAKSGGATAKTGETFAECIHGETAVPSTSLGPVRIFSTEQKRYSIYKATHTNIHHDAECKKRKQHR